MRKMAKEGQSLFQLEKYSAWLEWELHERPFLLEKEAKGNGMDSDLFAQIKTGKALFILGYSKLRPFEVKTVFLFTWIQ